MNAGLRAALSPMRRPCGSLRLSVMGETCVLRCSGALWLPDHSTLVAGDLHLEKGSAFAARGQMLPPYDSRATLDRLAAEIAELDPGVVILLGDSFHDSRAIGRMAGDDRARLDLLAQGRDWLWIEGNHDRRALEQADMAGLPGRVVGHLSVGALSLTHEPSPAPWPGEVAGHLHPAVRIVGHGRSVRRPCFVTDGRRLLLPAFGVFTGGLNVRDPAVAGLFETPPLIAALGRDRVHAVAWDKAAAGR
ncbi:MAG: ligase-associated DNA damage response endonuclease PdeM [Brevundimonas sp.]|uniref:ligase-associated DNA damage response endonuclease PdeM n=1 Tax=Brevundimonas sp. TaxID=1871086 RepID=UPI0025BCBE03|nr:ligase-associated DNA damage response endonuclease PdeM [Brevundimonas sp.]MBX3476779.1 ligase-associated DNA damage response endonuclease PdeM [Brevundimonas sp.]